MIRMTFEERQCPVELFCEQHAREAVREGHRGQRHAPAGTILEVGMQAVGAADEEGDIAPIPQPALQRTGQRAGGDVLAAFAERDARAAGGKCRCRNGPRGGSRPARCGPRGASAWRTRRRRSRPSLAGGGRPRRSAGARSVGGEVRGGRSARPDAAPTGEHYGRVSALASGARARVWTTGEARPGTGRLPPHSSSRL